MAQARFSLSRILGEIADRLLHPARARAARRAVSGARIQKVLILCLGNMCRSPFAEASLRKHLASRGRADVEVWSAGFVGSDRPSPETAQSVARDLGYDLSRHRSRMATPQDFLRADLVVVMSSEQASNARWKGVPSRVPIVPLGDFDPGPIRTQAIVDPLGEGEDVFRDCYLRIDRCVSSLAGHLAGAVARGRS